MFSGLHGLIYTKDPEGVRAFFRDVLGFAHVDAGDGWLIFAMPPAELGVHPVRGDGIANDGHQLLLMCDDIEATVAELEGRGVTFAQPPTDEGFGIVAVMRIPGDGTLGVYQPHHPTALGLTAP